MRITQIRPEDRPRPLTYNTETGITTDENPVEFMSLYEPGSFRQWIIRVLQRFILGMVIGAVVSGGYCAVKVVQFNIDLHRRLANGVERVD